MREHLVSDVYTPASPNRLQNDPINGHYIDWGYAVAYEQDQDGQSYPEGGNTAIFRIYPQGMTEPVFVTKPQAKATFTVTVLAGEGTLIKSTVDGKVEEVPLEKGGEIVIHPGEAYSYKNTSNSRDLVLHDVAMPKFKKGDDADVSVSELPQRLEERPRPKKGYSACVVRTTEDESKVIELPNKFHDLIGQAAATDVSNHTPFIRLGRLYQQAYERAVVSMPKERRDAYLGWLSTHQEYQPSFGERMGRAIEWVEQHPDEFDEMVSDFDDALRFLNDSTGELDEELFPNIVDYRENRLRALPLLTPGSDRVSLHDAASVFRAIKDSANKLRWGETIQPEDGDWYSFHTFVKSDRGMVAACLADLYENYTKALGIYPKWSEIDAIVANVITEAVYLTHPNGILFQAFKNPDDEWIKDYPGFSDSFQRLVYGSQPEKVVN